eukprot:m.479712 g.479712  ORF g.479712 m.479712 type:complete len:394 (+) comp21570_c0_seq1:436-1617(+)
MPCVSLATSAACVRRLGVLVAHVQAVPVASLSLSQRVDSTHTTKAHWHPCRASELASHRRASTCAQQQRSSLWLRRSVAALSVSLLGGAVASRRGLSSLPGSSPPVPVTSVSLQYGAACQGKRASAPSTAASPCSAASSCSHGDCGDDAFCIEDCPSHVVLGVADGVGGWREVGVDPGLFSAELVANVGEVARHSRKPPSTVAMLRRAYDALLRSDKVEAGSSTMCLASLDKHHSELAVANLGDSGAIVIRDDEIIFATTEQNLGFNAPLQLSMSQDQGNSLVACPEDADVSFLQVQPGDCIILASDGLFDNMFPDDIVQRTKDLGVDASPQDVADVLLSEARHNGLDQDWLSPFAKRAREYGYACDGGKHDDICIVCAKVVQLDHEGMTRAH